MAEFAANKALLPIIQDAPLIGYTTKKSYKGQELWRDRPCVIMVVRRPGCALCRAQARQLADLRPKLSELGVDLVAVSHQDNSVDEFITGYFGRKEGQEDVLLLDPTRAFYKAIGGGEEKTQGFLGIFSTKVWKNNSAASKLGTKGNFSGDYSHLGGVMLVGRGDAGVLWYFQEVNFGDCAPIDVLMKAVHQSVNKI